jgi:hypothetical protein
MPATVRANGQKYDLFDSDGKLVDSFFSYFAARVRQDLLNETVREQSPAMKAALTAIDRETAACIYRSRKDMARAILRGEPNRHVSNRPLHIAQRFARLKLHQMEARDPA